MFDLSSIEPQVNKQKSNEMITSDDKPWDTPALILVAEMAKLTLTKKFGSIVSWHNELIFIGVQWSLVYNGNLENAKCIKYCSDLINVNNIT